MKQSVLGGTTRERLLQNGKIVLCAVLCLLFVVLAVLEGVSGTRAGDVYVKDTITVSSALIDTAYTRWSTQVVGTLEAGEKGLKVDRVIVTVVGDRGRQKLELDGFVLLPRSSERLYFGTETAAAFDRVRSVELIIDGETRALNNSVTVGGGGGVWVCSALALLAALALARVCMVRYYMSQELKMRDKM